MRDGHEGQTIRDLRAQRKLWRLPAGEHAAGFSDTGGLLLTITAPTGANEVRVLRARTARTGELVATFRGTLEQRAEAWESPTTFVMLAADGSTTPTPTARHGATRP